VCVCVGSTNLVGFSFGPLKSGSFSVLYYVMEFNAGSSVKVIACGKKHTAALTPNGSVVCWGDNGKDQCTVPPAVVKAVSVSCAMDHTGAITKEGRVICWGDNGYGQCSVPGDLSNVIALSCGEYHTAALTHDGKVRCWGLNDHGQCSVPAALEKVTAVSCGGWHTAAVKEDRTMELWGLNTEGQCSPPSEVRDVVSISCGRRHTAALTAQGKVFCWGNDGGVLGNVENAVAISSGYFFTAAITCSEEVRCWGVKDVKSNVPADLRLIAIDCGNEHVAAITHEGQVVCWGRSGQNRCAVPSDLKVMSLEMAATLIESIQMRGRLASVVAERVQDALELECLRDSHAVQATELTSLRAQLQQEIALRKAAESRLNRALYGHFDAGVSFSRSLAHLLLCCDNVYDCSVEEAVFGLHSNPGVSCLQPHLCSVDCDEKYIRATVQELRRELEDFLLNDQILVNNPTLSLDHLLAIKLYTFGNDRLKFFAAINTPFYDPNRTRESLKDQLPSVRLLIRSLRALGSCTQFERVVVFRGARIQDSPYLQQVRNDYINNTTNNYLIERKLLRFPSFTSTSKKESKAVAGFGSDFVYVITLNHNVSMFLMHGCDRKLICLYCRLEWT
jgi:hypothetical protein